MIKLKNLLMEDLGEVLIASDRKFVLGHLDKIQKELNQAKRDLKKGSNSGSDMRRLSNSLKGIAVRATAMGEHVGDAIEEWARRANRPPTSPYST